MDGMGEVDDSFVFMDLGQSCIASMDQQAFLTFALK